MHYKNDNPHMPTAVQFAPTTCTVYRVCNKYMFTKIQRYIDTHIIVVLFLTQLNVPSAKIKVLQNRNTKYATNTLNAHFKK